MKLRNRNKNCKNTLSLEAQNVGNCCFGKKTTNYYVLGIIWDHYHNDVSTRSFRNQLNKLNFNVVNH